MLWWEQKCTRMVDLVHPALCRGNEHSTLFLQLQSQEPRLRVAQW